MSLETLRSMQNAYDPDARRYLESHFETLLQVAIGEFATVGWCAIGLSLTVVLTTLGLWILLRRRFPVSWGWLLPVMGFTLYAFIKAAVIYQLIQNAQQFPQMWELYFKPWTPLRMVRTPLVGQLVLIAAMFATVYLRARFSNAVQHKRGQSVTFIAD